ncbi:MAG: homoserine dehydrogenase, partial [Pseudomonadales bacterium]
ASIAFGIPLQFDRIYTQGISRIKNEDVVHAGELGFVIKHLGIARRGTKGIELRVHPTLIPKERMIAKVDGVMNAVMIEGDAVGPTLYYGAGAGAEPTASSVIANLIEIARQKDVDPEARSSYLGVPMSKLKDTPVVDIEDCETSFYLRFTAADKPGVLNKITQLLSNAELSVEAIQQKEPISGSAEATIVMVTHKAVESELRKVVASLER